MLIPMIKIALPVVFQGFTGFTCLLNIANDEDSQPLSMNEFGHGNTKSLARKTQS
jgi:hypothetical protein